MPGPSKIRIVESGQSTSGYCGLFVKPIVIPACKAATGIGTGTGATGSGPCFDVSGTTLTFEGEAVFTGYAGSTHTRDFTKLSD